MTASKPFLFDAARRELEQDSAIDPAVIAERGYESIHRHTNGDQRQRERLRSLQMPTWAIKEDSYFPGLLIPMFGPTGSRVSAQWKPRMPVPNRVGKKQKYASPKGQTSRLDVHPRNRSAIVDPTAELWITEGIKKGDSLTSRGICAISLTGVFNWRSQLGTLGDWEDVILKGRVVTICFDSDARTNSNVLRAMVRFGRWLKSKGVRKINYLIVPAEARATAGQVGNTNAVEGWRTMLSAGRERSVLSLARGIVERQVTDLDRDLDLLNTPSGVVDLATGELLPHDPALFMTKITGAEYRPGFTHPDWDTALEAVPADIQDWYQLRLGQAITGHITP